MKNIRIALVLSLLITGKHAAAQLPLTAEQWMACTHLSHLNFSNVPADLDERHLQTNRVLYDNNNHGTLVFGSSRGFHLDAEAFGDSTLLNHCMSAGTLEDALGMYSYYLAKGMKPRRVVLELSPWILNANNGLNSAWKAMLDPYLRMDTFLTQHKEISKSAARGLPENFSLYNEAEFKFNASDFDSVNVKSITIPAVDNPEMSLHHDALHVLGNFYLEKPSFYESVLKNNHTPDEMTSSIVALVSETQPYRNKVFDKLKPYQKNNIALLNRLLLVVVYGFPERELREVFPTREWSSDVMIYHSDGSLTYSKSFREQDTLTVNSQALNSIDWGIVSYLELDPKRRNLFELFVKHLTHNNIEVIFFLSPYHPRNYHVYSTDKRYSSVISFEKYVRAFAAGKKNVRVIGSLNPGPYKLNSADFYDGMHIKRNTVVRILSEGGIGR